MKISIAVVLLAAVGCAFAASDKKPLTNSDVIKMVKADLSEATIILAIQANPHDFDPSVDALIELKASGATAKVIETVLQPSVMPPSSPATATPSPSLDDTNSLSASSSPDQRNRPFVLALNGTGERTRLQATPFKIIETKAKGNNVAMLLAESAVTDVAGDIIRTGAVNVILATGGRFLGTIGGVASGLTNAVGKKIFKSDEISLTYVCALGGRQSVNSIAADSARFDVHFADVFGADPEEFEPVIIKVSPTPKNWRLVGAIKAKKSEFTAPSQASEFSVIEDRVPLSTKKLGRGHVEISPVSPLSPGEYAVVLRPLMAGKKIILHEVEQEHGEGIVLRPVWDFFVPVPPVIAEEKN